LPAREAREEGRGLAEDSAWAVGAGMRMGGCMNCAGATQPKASTA